jgi:hypothetical protein
MRPSASSRSRLNGLGGMREDTDSHNDDYVGNGEGDGLMLFEIRCFHPRSPGGSIAAIKLKVKY